jgi:DNA-binding response OmpR family regulator
MIDSPTVLVVDDDEAVTKTFERALIVGGYRVLTAQSAADALHQLDTCRPNVVILDVFMPLVNGLGLLYRIRSLDTHQHLPVLIVTGGSLSQETLAEIEALGATVRQKPIPASELLAVTRLLLTR